MAYSLPLTAGKTHAAFAQNGVVAVGELQDELVGGGGARGAEHLGVGAPGRPKLMLFRALVLKRTVSCITIPMEDRSEFRVRSRKSWPSRVMRPAVGVVKARDEVGDSALARAAAPDNREGAAGRDVDVQVADDRSAAVHNRN